MFKALTVEREFGAGGSLIARKAAERLGWSLLDGALIGAVAREARIDRETALRYDERVDSWWRRFHRAGLWSLAIEAGFAPGDVWFPDAESMAVFARQAIARAAGIGNCVIVGRGAQCVLQDREDVFHVFIYGPLRERASRVRRRLNSPEEAGESIRLIDGERARYHPDVLRMRLEGAASLPDDDQLANRPGQGGGDDRQRPSAKQEWVLCGRQNGDARLRVAVA